jgi:hypothetical protein
MRGTSDQAGNGGRSNSGPVGNRYDNETMVGSLSAIVEVSRHEVCAACTSQQTGRCPVGQVRLLCPIGTAGLRGKGVLLNDALYMKYYVLVQMVRFSTPDFKISLLRTTMLVSRSFQR